MTADGSLDIPSNGTYYFRQQKFVPHQSWISNLPSSLVQATMLSTTRSSKRDNHQWISYIGYDYERYYADIAALKAENTSSNTEATRDETIPERGTYY